MREGERTAARQAVQMLLGDEGRDEGMREAPEIRMTTVELAP